MIPEFPNNGTVLVKSFDEYLALKHSTGHVSPALGALFRDRYGEDCSVLVCDEPAEVVFILLNHPTIVVPFCESHALQMREGYADLAEHLPKLTSATKRLFPNDDDSDNDQLGGAQ